MTKTNNLFYFATSELSQDAFLCWWLAWADKSYQITNPELHLLGLDFLELLAKKSGVTLGEVSNVELKTQYKNIDILCIVNKQTVFLIEDKTDTSEHGEQLTKYKSTLDGDDNFKHHRVFPVFIKTGDQSNYTKVLHDGYKLLKRQDLLSVLQAHPKALTRSDIAKDFTENLQNIESVFVSYASLPVNNWKSGAWRGFFCNLQTLLPELGLNWSLTVPQGQKGFWTCYSKSIEIELNGIKRTIYIQIEEQRLRFKIGGFGKKHTDCNEKCRLFHNYYRTLLASLANQADIQLTFSNKTPGDVITVGTFDCSFPVFSQGTLNIEKTLGLIQTAKKIIHQCTNN